LAAAAEGAQAEFPQAGLPDTDAVCDPSGFDHEMNAPLLDEFAVD
jgi:hypothetical protein